MKTPMSISEFIEQLDRIEMEGKSVLHGLCKLRYIVTNQQAFDEKMDGIIKLYKEHLADCKAELRDQKINEILND